MTYIYIPYRTSVICNKQINIYQAILLSEIRVEETTRESGRELSLSLSSAFSFFFRMQHISIIFIFRKSFRIRLWNISYAERWIYLHMHACTIHIHIYTAVHTYRDRCAYVEQLFCISRSRSIGRQLNIAHMRWLNLKKSKENREKQQVSTHPLKIR